MVRTIGGGDRPTRDRRRQTPLLVGEVTSTDRENHRVGVRFPGQQTQSTFTVAEVSMGDSSLPRPGDNVVLLRGESDRTVVIGVIHTEDAVPDVERGERIISHPGSDTRIRIREDEIIIEDDEGEELFRIDQDGAYHDGEQLATRAWVEANFS